MNPRIPNIIEPLLDDYLSLSRQYLPGFVNAFYLVGSIALDGFNERWSDIDFLAVTEQRPAMRQIKALLHIHTLVRRRHRRWRMSGSYLQDGDLGRFENEIPPHPYYHDCFLHCHGHFELNSVTWWILKNRGIAVVGREPNDLCFKVDWPHLIATMR